MIIRIALFACVLLMTAGLVPGESPRTAAAMPNQPQQVLTFVDGYGGNVFTAKDNQMEKGRPFNNGGLHANIQFEREQRAVMEFDLSSIPASATVLDATLYLYHSYDPENKSPATIHIYSITAANSTWVAGTQNLKTDEAGASCWGALASNGHGGVQKPWAGSAGLSTKGVDYEPNAIGSFLFDATSPRGTEYAIPLNKARVQGWLGPNNTNYGIVFFTDSYSSGHVAQSSHSTTQLRPKLVVHYTLSSVEYKYREYLPALKK